MDFVGMSSLPRIKRDPKRVPVSGSLVLMVDSFVSPWEVLLARQRVQIATAGHLLPRDVKTRRENGHNIL